MRAESLDRLALALSKVRRLRLGVSRHSPWLTVSRQLGGGGIGRGSREINLSFVPLQGSKSSLAMPTTPADRRNWMGETATEGQGTALAAESEVDNTHKRREWEPECVRACVGACDSHIVHVYQCAYTQGDRAVLTSAAAKACTSGTWRHSHPDNLGSAAAAAAKALLERETPGHDGESARLCTVRAHPAPLTLSQCGSSTSQMDSPAQLASPAKEAAPSWWPSPRGGPGDSSAQTRRSTELGPDANEACGRTSLGHLEALSICWCDQFGADEAGTGGTWLQGVEGIGGDEQEELEKDETRCAVCIGQSIHVYRVPVHINHGYIDTCLSRRVDP